MVSLTALRNLARLCSRGVVGAESQLLALRRKEPIRLAELLMLPRPEMLATYAPALVAQIRSATVRARARRDQASLRAAAQHLEALRQSACFGDGYLGLDPAAFISAIRSIARGSLYFELGDHGGSIDLRLLRRLGRICRGVEFTDARIEPGCLVVRYRSPGSHGHYRLHLSATAKSTPVFRVSPRRPPPTRSSPRGRLWDHLLDAVGTAV